MLKITFQELNLKAEEQNAENYPDRWGNTRLSEEEADVNGGCTPFDEEQLEISKKVNKLHGRARMSSPVQVLLQEKTSWCYRINFWKTEKAVTSKQIFHSRENAKLVLLIWILVN